MTKKNIRILLIEDDDVDSEALERFFKKTNRPYELKIASTENEAVDALAAFEFDIVLLDYNLQTTTGMDLLPNIEDIPVIFVTGHGSEEIAIEAMRHGIYDYIIKDADQNYLKIMPFTIKNALERKHAEKEFKSSEERFRALTENTTDLTVIIDKKSTVSYINPTIKHRFDYSAEEVLGKNSSELIHPDDMPMIDKKGLKAIKNPGESIILDDFRVQHKNGSWIYLTGHMIYLPDVSGINGLVGNFQDISLRKQAEEKLAASQRQLDVIINTVPDIIYRLDAEGKITFISDAIQHYGYMPETLLGTSIFDLIYQEDKDKAKDKINERRTRDRISRSFEVRFLTKEQGNVPFEIFSVSAEGLYNSKHASHEAFMGTQGIARDITQRKEAENERERLINELREALENVKALNGLLPICSNCKKIRDDKGYWNLLECYLEDHSEASFSHSICPECSDKLYGHEDWYQSMKNDEGTG